MWRNPLADPPLPDPAPQADVCLIAEGCYPYVSGGVSNWIDWLIRSQPDLTFSVLAILPGIPTTEPRYQRPPNLRAIDHLYLDGSVETSSGSWPRISPTDMSELMGGILQQGEPAEFERLIRILRESKRPSLDAMLNSPQGWQSMCDYYRHLPHASFLGYFWAWRTLVGGLLRVLNFKLPPARLYHAVSTGYAGLLGARASVETGMPSLITEHGIYSNERRIEILMADWIANSIDNGLDLSDSRTDIREFWATAFDSFARISYAAATEITALYAANQSFQRILGAADEKLLVVPNGVDVARFSELAPVEHEEPTIAFIGRVTPIKDVQTFLDVADILRKQFPTLRALVIGPMDEDPDYAEACINEAQSRGLDSVVTFTGPADVRAHLARIDVLVLTSISEAQPLVVLEAGAASVPCVTTDVGACREMLEGALGGHDHPPGGIVVPVGASEEMAAQIGTLLADPDLRRSYGANLHERVTTHYRAEVIADSYRALYARTLASQHEGVS